MIVMTHEDGTQVIRVIGDNPGERQALQVSAKVVQSQFVNGDSLIIPGEEAAILAAQTVHDVAVVASRIKKRE